MTHEELTRASVLLAMAAGIVARERNYSKALADEFRTMAATIRGLADERKCASGLGALEAQEAGGVA